MPGGGFAGPAFLGGETENMIRRSSGRSGKGIIRRVTAVCLLILLAAGLSSCGNGSRQGRVYWLNYKPEIDATLQKLARRYREETGVEVRVITAASGTYAQTLLAEMDKSAPPTLFVLSNTADVAMWKDYAMDLAGTPIAGELTTDAYNLYDESGKLAAIGYCYECYGIIVNPALVEASGHSMEELTGFDGLKAVAEDIHSRAGELGFDAFTSSDMDSSSSWRFTGHMVNLEYVYEERAAGTIWKECPPAISGAYLDYYRKLFSLCINNSTVPPHQLATGGHDAQQEFISGKAAFYINGSWEYDAVSKAVPGAVMIPYYCGMEGEENAGLNCGTSNYWAINASVSEADRQATMDFVMWLATDPEASAEMVREVGVMPFRQAAPSRNGFLKNAEEYTARGCYVMDWATNFQPNTDQYRAGLVSALIQYCADQSDENWEAFRSAFVDGWAIQYAAIQP